MLLEVKNLCVFASGKEILKKCSLAVPRGRIHAVMGPNGSGKSTLCGVLLGHEKYTVKSGTACFEGKDLLPLSVDERARRGIFLGFQHPLEIPGVSLFQLLRAAREARRNKTPSAELLATVKRELTDLHLGEEFAGRPVNEHASGGEKKRLEIAQLRVIPAKLAILDEIDSGLDVDSLKTIASVISRTAREHGTAFLVITHYQRLLNHLTPDCVHIMMDGAVVASGGMELVSRLEKDGYKSFARPPRGIKRSARWSPHSQ